MTNKELCDFLSNFPAEAEIQFELKDKLLAHDIEHWQIGEQNSIISFIFLPTKVKSKRNILYFEGKDGETIYGELAYVPSRI